MFTGPWQSLLVIGLADQCESLSLTYMIHGLSRMNWVTDADEIRPKGHTPNITNDVFAPFNKYLLD